MGEVASWRAGKVAQGASVNGDRTVLQQGTQRLYQAGYQPHSWTETVFVVEKGREPFTLADGKKAKRSWFKELREGDFLDAGIGIEQNGERCIYTFIFALPKLVFQWREVAALEELDQVRWQMLGEINKIRQSKGRRALASDPHLDRVAQGHAEDMLARSYYSHRNPEGETVRQRAAAAGYPAAKVIAENIAKGRFGPIEVLHRWMASSGHRNNLLRRNVSAVGNGVAVGEDEGEVQVLWVQVFAGGRNEPRR